MLARIHCPRCNVPVAFDDGITGQRVLRCRACGSQVLITVDPAKKDRRWEHLAAHEDDEADFEQDQNAPGIGLDMGVRSW